MKKVIFAVIVILFTLYLNAYDTSYTVKQNGTGDYTEIQDAIDAVSNGYSAIIYVYGSATAYTGSDNTNLTWDGSNKHIWLYGIESGGYDPWITGARALNLSGSSINNTDKMSGFDLSNSSFFYPATPYKGGCILIDNGAAPIIEDCTFYVYMNASSSDTGTGGGIFCNGPAIIRDCTFEDCESLNIDGGLAMAIQNGTTVEDCNFVDNYCGYSGPSHTTKGSGIYILPSTSGTITVENCIFTGNDNVNGEGGLIHIAEDTNGTDIDFINNTIIDNTGGNDGLISCEDNSGDTTIENCVFYDNTCSVLINLEIGADVDFDYNLTYQTGTVGGYAGSNCITGENPDLHATTYQPLWSSSTKSPCIDTGNPILTDDDDTPSDIGAVCAVSHRFDVVELPDTSTNSGIKWLSFPALDIVLDDADLAENALSSVLDPAILERIYFLDDDDIYYYQFNWQNDDRQLLRTEGCIFEMNDDYDLDVPGFKVSDETTIAVYGSSTENWVGYWIDETQHVSDAFEDYWEDENITLIQHQFWSAAYNDEEWVYRMVHEQEPTLSYGTMVIVKCNTTISNFQWSTGTPEEQRTSFPETEYFSYTEQTDYTPIFIELEENDLPREIGAYVNGTCIGATVVDGTLAQINAYTSLAPPGNVELEFYYSSRSTNKTFSNYKCGNLENPDYVSQQINTSEVADAWFISFRDDSSMVPSPANITLNNYPNPFNPSTTISYSLPKEDQITLSIYNIKGQLVKILIEGSQPEGYYEVTWNGKDEAGKHVSSGIYYYRINTCGKTLNKKMIILK